MFNPCEKFLEFCVKKFFNEMKVGVICVIFLMVSFLNAVPTDYVYETWIKPAEEIGSSKFENRLGLIVKNTSDKNTETTDTEETTEDDELNRLFNNFWAVDNLPKQSAFVSIKKLPDVYIDENDQPCPISDMMTVERSEITEEAKDLHAPEFGERPLYDASMQLMDNVGDRNQPQYTNFMPYPQYPSDQNYEDIIFCSDNNTMYPQEVKIDHSYDKTNKKLASEKNAFNIVLHTSTIAPSTSTEITTLIPIENFHNTTSFAIEKKDSTPCTSQKIPTTKTGKKEVQACNSTSSSISPNAGNVMKISVHNTGKKGKR